MKQLVLFVLLWQCYLFSADDDMHESPAGFVNACSSAVNSADRCAMNKNREAAITSFARLRLLADADIQYFNDSQIEALFTLYGTLTRQIEAAFCIEDVSTYVIAAQKREISSLITKIKRNQLDDDWAALVGEFDDKPAENIVTYQRVEFLKKLKEDFGQQAPIAQLHDDWLESTEAAESKSVQNIVI